MALKFIYEKWRHFNKQKERNGVLNRSKRFYMSHALYLWLNKRRGASTITRFLISSHSLPIIHD